MIKDPTKIYFSIPSYWYLYSLNMNLLSLMDKENHKFYDDIVIDSCFGCVPGCVWNGGRGLNAWGKVTGEKILKIANDFNNYGVSLRHTFTNMLIEEKHTYDTIGNTVLKLTENNSTVQNGCNIYSEILFNYIKQNYPNIQLVWSTTKEIKNIDEINKLSKDNLLVLSYTLNNHFDQLEQIKYPQHIEILCSEEGCIDNCPVREQHNLITSLTSMCDLEAKQEFQCPRKLNNLTSYYYDTTFNRFYYITIDDIRSKYLPLGFNKFKISGRSEEKISVINTIENYVLYFVKPEYQNDIRNKLLIKCFA